uniref:Uncharacterized protein n=1 Tax=Physcomitrium patens TaxID=3218 RepID=A0A2K1JTT7_PHYPA|nr:hypothetical protein PHYPA_014712 [Physcomitrium patens]
MSMIPLRRKHLQTAPTAHLMPTAHLNAGMMHARNQIAPTLTGIWMRLHKHALGCLHVNNQCKEIPPVPAPMKVAAHAVPLLAGTHTKPKPTTTTTTTRRRARGTASSRHKPGSPETGNALH